MSVKNNIVTAVHIGPEGLELSSTLKSSPPLLLCIVRHGYGWTVFWGDSHETALRAIISHVLALDTDMTAQEICDAMGNFYSMGSVLTCLNDGVGFCADSGRWSLNSNPGSDDIPF